MTKRTIIYMAVFFAGYWAGGGVNDVISEVQLAYRATDIAEKFRTLYCATREGKPICGQPVERAVSRMEI